ncbi:ATP-grasp domain-containing protein [Cyclobacterium sediminis]
MNILLTSVGRRSYMIDYFKEVIKGTGLVHAANSEETYAMTLADQKVISPPIYDNSYIDFLLNYCQKHQIAAVISLFDIDLPVLSQNKEIFENQGVKLVVSDFPVTERCNDKWFTYCFLKDNGIGTPLSFISLEACKKALQNKDLQYPLIIKPRWGMGSIGIYQADNEQELEVLYKKTQNAITSSYLKYESAADINKAIIIQEKIKGDEYGIDVLNDLKGEFICTVAKQKMAMRAGETDIARVISHPDLEKLGNQLSLLLKHIGNLDVDCFLIDDKIYVLELNCRFGGQYPFSHLAGANFPKIIVDLLNEKEVDENDYTIASGTVGCKDLKVVRLN